eukprot:CAMPEP_0184858066 /NCGR_PEP_ID=MMETSP0580-20130426/3175_1 /TAXON_ID=1118495 /ORGANISM="Dactyliosolen fragilissimus" /LENGTH=428 /DNA_ID=CAMNT_0027353987 /DNA_START=18 /DNA_END=1301 /DNA_ORIENTATION=-
MNLSSTPFSLHNDVLSATPSSTDEKLRLISELKSRGRVSVTSKRYPDGRDLYSKAIEVMTTLIDGENDTEHKKELAILYSNRSLCNLQMNKSSEARDDATSATCYDATYVKGFWRLGQACTALDSPDEALVAYDSALELDSSNKALKKECVKVRDLVKKKEEEKKRIQAEEEKDNAVKKDAMKKAVTLEKKSSSSSKQDEKKVEESSDKAAVDNDFSTSDHVRGYKIVGGKKTSFFHHEQTEEEKRLIGDITPKRIETATNNPGETSNTNSSEIKGVSAWNKAGTWEERNLTPWAIETLTGRLMECSYTLPPSSPDPNAQIKVMKVSKLDPAPKGSAHASVATVRGKKRYIYEFTICIHWEAMLTNGSVCKGNMTFLDIDGTHEIGDGYDISNYQVDNDTPPDSRYLLERFVRDDGLRGVLEKCIDNW